MLAGRLALGGGGQLRRRLRAIVELNAMSEEAKQNQPTEADYKAFDFLWQHLRLNEHYRKAWNELRELESREAELERKAKQEKEERLCKLRKRYDAGEIRGPEYVAEQEKETPAEVELRTVREHHGAIAMTIGYGTDLPTEVDLALFDPAEKDSRKVLDRIVAEFPGYLESASFQRVRLKTSGAAAIWNCLGSECSAWQNTPGEHGDIRTFNELDKRWEDARQRGDREAEAKCKAALDKFHAERKKDKRPSGDSRTFEDLDSWLASAKQQGDGEAVKKCEANMAEFLQGHSQMDFVLDTSLPVETVIGELRKELRKVKRLRKSVKLLNEKRGRLRDWPKHLELYKAYLPTWKHRKAVREIGQRALGFEAAVQVLGLRLTQSDLDLVRRIDAHNLKPKDFFEIYDEQKGRALVREGWDEGVEYLARQRERRTKRRSAGFDDPVDAPLTAVLSKKALRSLPADDLGDVGVFLERFRHFLSVPHHSLRSPLDRISPKNRNRWFHWARERIEATWRG